MQRNYCNHCLKPVAVLSAIKNQINSSCDCYLALCLCDRAIDLCLLSFHFAEQLLISSVSAYIIKIVETDVNSINFNHYKINKINI